MEKSERMKLTSFELVYPPISNQEAVWLQKDPEVENLLRQSDFYMIAGRQEMKLGDFAEVGLNVEFTVSIGDDFTDMVSLSVFELPAVSGTDPEMVVTGLGPKGIRIWNGQPDEGDTELIEWFTTEKLINDRSRGMLGISMFDQYLTAATYDLLYVGIAKVGDTFDRLIKNGHKARMDILANEPQRYPGARVSDEIYLFMFKAYPLVLTVFGSDHDFEDEGLAESNLDMKRIVADAEKAFVSTLIPTYNSVRFKQYPRGRDGLYGADYTRYAYQIRENLTFRTAHGVLHGGRDPLTGSVSNAADRIFIDGDVVTFIEGDSSDAGAI